MPVHFPAMESIGAALPSPSAGDPSPPPSAAAGGERAGASGSPDADELATLLQDALAEAEEAEEPPPQAGAELGFELVQPAVPPAVLREAEAAAAQLRRLLLAAPGDGAALPEARSMHAKAALLSEALRLGDGRLLLRVLLRLRASLADGAFYALLSARPAARRRWLAHMRHTGRFGELRRVCRGAELALVLLQQALAGQRAGEGGGGVGAEGGGEQAAAEPCLGGMEVRCGEGEERERRR